MIELGALVDKPTLTGDRVRLVPMERRHAKDLFNAIAADAEARRLTGTHHEFTLDEIERFAEGRAEQQSRLDLVIEDKTDGAFLGDLALLDVDPPNAGASVRIALGTRQTGKGLGTEAMRLLLAYAFNVVKLHRVQLDVFEFNERAIRSYEKCGFQQEGRLRDALHWDGQWYASLIMSVLSTDWSK